MLFKKSYILEKRVEIVSFRELFKYATKRELIIMSVAVLAAILHGALLPFFTIIFGSVIDAFGTQEDSEEVIVEIGYVARWFFVLGGASFLTSVIQVRFQLYFAQNVAFRVRKLYFSSLISQEYSFISQNDPGELSSRLSDISLLESAIGDKLSTTIQLFSLFVTGFTIALIYGWKLTLILLSITPVLAAGGILFAKLAAESSGTGQDAYGAAGAIASEVISLIRTVKAYNGQETEAKKYDEFLEKAYKSGVRKSALSGVAFGFNYFVIFCTFAVAFTFGLGQVRSGSMNAGDLIVVCVSIFFSTTAIGKTAEGFKAIANARGAMPKIYKIIEKESKINPIIDMGEELSEWRGEVRFENVSFDYHSNEPRNNEAGYEAKVLNNIDVTFLPGTRNAIVGKSGSGKSTIARLIERYYDVDSGQILIDGVNVKDLSVKHLRKQIGYVGQMPTLFMLSIRDNIALGAGEEHDPEEFDLKSISMNRIISAAKDANAHDFIMSLPNGYDTVLGERGVSISGGQKQLICIARALIGNPKILILDESTSALDARSEKIVQEALNKASSGRTTIMIAHRLSTIRNANKIFVLDSGKVIESGDHSSLIQQEGGAYKTLFEAQDVNHETILEDNSRENNESRADSTDSTEFSIPHSNENNVAAGSSEINVNSEFDSGIVRRAFETNKEEGLYILLGIFGACLGGASFPIIAIISANNIDILFNPNNEGRVRFWAIIFVIVGAASFAGYFLQFFMLGISGEKLTLKLRSRVFRSIIRQDISFFDEKENSPGILNARLATESNLVKGLTGDTLGSAAVMTSTLLSGFIIAFISCWRVSLVVLAVLPLLGISEAANIKLISGFDADNAKRYDNCGAILSEALSNYESVTSLSAQTYFLDIYNRDLDATLLNGRKTALFASIAFGIAEFLGQAFWAIAFWVGSVFVRRGQCSFIELMKAISGLLFAGAALGQSSLFVPDFSRAKIAATKVFQLIDRDSSIEDGLNSNSTSNIPEKFDVHMKEVYFKYPSRPEVQVLNGFSISFLKGKSISLVGRSGCGKSTVLSLLQRLYDPQSGTIMLNEEHITDFDVKALRNSIGYVPQEPDLFSRTIMENIMYGLPHSSGTPVTREQAIDAAKSANVHEFIERLPEGYDTHVGFRGSKLSGGQRQRVAIARSIIRNPELLLLDEATSALDAQSERSVQTALNIVSKSRTTISVAHRLSSIINADLVALVQEGKIVEMGTHEELIKKNGFYANLVTQQLQG